MSGTLFDQGRDERVHACAGVHCQVCALDMSRIPGVQALARSSDPGTSKKAARSVHREGHLQALLEAYRGAELTSEEAATVAGIDPWQASKRTSDLLSAGLIEPVTVDGRTLTRKGVSGRSQRVLKARDE